VAEQWRIVGDFIDFCRCRVPCACSWGQPPDEEECDGVIGYRIREGNYGDVTLDGLNFVGVSHFVGNIWDDATRADMGFIVDERADESQREALQTIFGGQVGSWPQMFAENVLGEMLGMEFAQIELDIADDSTSWSVRIPGKVRASAEIVTGPTSKPGQHVRVMNLPAAESGPNSGEATYGIASENTADAFGLKFELPGRSAKHIPFEWSSEDQF
jgi:hypothetical protein